MRFFEASLELSFDAFFLPSFSISDEQEVMFYLHLESLSSSKRVFL